eukprot:8774189-Lingulodinium_polyedra.AAC.1
METLSNLSSLARDSIVTALYKGPAIYRRTPRHNGGPRSSPGTNARGCSESIAPARAKALPLARAREISDSSFRP